MTDSHESRDTPRHPIAVVSERTGLSQDVLRVWERRYGAVTPSRAAGGQRRYSDADIERLALLHAATRAGRSISHVAALAAPALAALVDEDNAARERRPPAPAQAGADEATIVAALGLARTFDSAALETMLRRHAASMGVAAFIDSLAAPLLRGVGDEWHAGRMTLAQEHLVSSLVHDIAAERMRSIAATTGSPRMLVATPAGDRHSIGAVLAGAAAAVVGWEVLYLGADLPALAIAEAAASAGVSVVAISIVYVEQPLAVIDELRILRSRLPPAITLIAGGGGAATIAAELSSIGVRVHASVSGLLSELRHHRKAA